MKKDHKSVYRKGTFTDYSGVERPYVFCAVSVELDTHAVIDAYDLVEFAPKALYIGLSVVHPDDVTRMKEVKVKGVPTQVPVYSEAIGEQIAYGKAMNERSRCGAVYVNQKGLINKTVVEAILKQEEDHFLANPANYIAGFEKARVEYKFDKLGGTELVEKMKAKAAELKELEKQANELYTKSLKHD